MGRNEQNPQAVQKRPASSPVVREASFVSRRPDSSFVVRISSFAIIDFPACEIRFTFHERRSS